MQTGVEANGPARMARLRGEAADDDQGNGELAVDGQEVSLRIAADRAAQALHRGDDLRHDARMQLPEAAVDLDVAEVAVGGVADQRVGADQAAETAAVGAGAGSALGPRP